MELQGKVTERDSSTEHVLMRFTKNWGFACEKLVAIDVVTADGEKRHCNKDMNADIYWAARGSGPGKFLAHVTLTERPKFVSRLSTSNRIPRCCYEIPHPNHSCFQPHAVIHLHLRKATLRSSLWLGCEGLSLLTPYLSSHSIIRLFR